MFSVLFSVPSIALFFAALVVAALSASMSAQIAWMDLDVTAKTEADDAAIGGAVDRARDLHRGQSGPLVLFAVFALMGVAEIVAAPALDASLASVVALAGIYALQALAGHAMISRLRDLRGLRAEFPRIVAAHGHRLEVA